MKLWLFLKRFWCCRFLVRGFEYVWWTMIPFFFLFWGRKDIWGRSLSHWIESRSGVQIIKIIQISISFSETCSSFCCKHWKCTSGFSKRSFILSICLNFHFICKFSFLFFDQYSFSGYKFCIFIHIIDSSICWTSITDVIYINLLLCVSSSITSKVI